MVASALFLQIVVFWQCQDSDFNSERKFQQQVDAKLSKLELAFQEFIKNRAELDISKAQKRLEDLQIAIATDEASPQEIYSALVQDLRMQALNFNAQRLLKSDLNQDEFLKLLEYRRSLTHLMSHLLFDPENRLSDPQKAQLKETLIDIVTGEGNLVLGAWLSNLNEAGLTPQEAQESADQTKRSSISKNVQKQGLSRVESPKPTVSPDLRQTKSAEFLDAEGGLEIWKENPNQNYDISAIVKESLKHQDGVVEFFYRNPQTYQNLPSQFEALRILIRLRKEKKLSDDERRLVRKAAEKIQTYTAQEKETLRNLTRELR